MRQALTGTSHGKNYITPDGLRRLSEEHRFLLAREAAELPRLDLSLAYRFLDAEDVSPGAARDQLQYQPRHRASLDARWRLPGGVSPRFVLSYVGEQSYYSQTVPIRRGALDGRVIMDASVDTVVAGGRSTVTLGARNLTGAAYEEPYAMPQPGREAYVPRPMFLTFVGDGAEVVAFANLLANDPINLVVSRDVAKARGLSQDMSLVDRLTALGGLRVGVAPDPPARLRALYEFVGLDAARDSDIVIVDGENQSAAFADGSVDALYTHTPYLERALDVQGGVMVVNQSEGEVPVLAGRQIHTAVTTRGYIAEHADVVSAFTRAL